MLVYWLNRGFLTAGSVQKILDVDYNYILLEGVLKHSTHGGTYFSFYGLEEKSEG